MKGQDEMATLSEKLILADRISELLKASTDREFRNSYCSLVMSREVFFVNIVHRKPENCGAKSCKA